MNGEWHTDQFPAVVPDEVAIYLTTPNRSIASALGEVVLRLGLESEEPYENVLAVYATAPQLHELSIVLVSEVCKVDLQETRCRLTTGTDAPTLSDLMRTERLWDLTRWIDGQWVKDLIQSQRLVTHFQPIVYCTEPSRVYAHECLLRGIDGEGKSIMPDMLFPAARGAGLLKQLDEAARLTAIRSASLSRLSGCVFVNLNPASVDDQAECLATTMAALSASDLPIERFVFEVVESDKIADVDQLLYLLDYFREVGCRVALDDLGGGYSSLNLLARIRPDFIKVNMGLMRNVDRDPYMRCITGKLLELAKELGVETVVEGVETVRQWQWAAEQGADFAQGYLFARPAADPPSSAFSGRSGDIDNCGTERQEADEPSETKESDMAR